MNVSLPAEMKQFLHERTQDGMYGSTSEYVRELIRSDQQKIRFRAMLLEAAASPVAATADAEYFEELRRRVGMPSGETGRSNDCGPALAAE